MGENTTDGLRNGGGRFDPVAELADARKRTSQYLSDRTRVISGAIVIAVWGLIEGESKSFLPLGHRSKIGLLIAAALGLAALFADYLQYLLQYLDVALEDSRKLGKWGGYMFRIKQVFALSSVAMFGLVCSFLLICATSLSAGPRVKFSIYKGEVWNSSSPAQKTPSRLYLKPSNPVTGDTQATEDDVACHGSHVGTTLILLCGGARFDGVLDRGSYAGHWTPISTPGEGGEFQYRFVRDVLAQPY